jgi:hypothetical protein
VDIGERAGMNNRSSTALFAPIWIGVGIWTALQNGYNSFDSFPDALSFFLAVMLWPAVLWGDFDLHFPATCPPGSLPC